MGLFGGLFGNKEGEKGQDKNELSWIQLTTEEQLVVLKEKSNARPQVIFKHSTSCGISRMVLTIFESGHELEEGQMDFYFLDLLRYRNISNKIAEIFNVQHQSPQLLIIKNGVVVAHDSHGSISDIDLPTYL